MSVPLAKIGAAAINAVKLTDEIRQNKYVFQRFDSQPQLSKLDGLTTATGATNDINVVKFDKFTALQNVIVTQTLLGPLLDTTGKGLDISQDQTDNDGVQYAFGCNSSDSSFTYVVGTNNAFVRLKFRIADVSGTDDCNIGFRKVEAFQANVDDYDEAAWVNVNLGVLIVETILNNAATISTTTTQTWLDDAIHTIEARLVGRAVSFLYDNAYISGLPAYNFDTAEVVQPFFYFLQATTSPGKVWWRELEMGQLKSVSATGVAA